MKKIGFELLINLNYNDFEKFKNYCLKNMIKMINTDYDEKVKCIIEVNEKEKNTFLENIDDFNFKIENIDILCNKRIRKIIKQ